MVNFCANIMNYLSIPISFLWVLGISVFPFGQLSHRLKVTWHWLRFRLDSSLSGNSGSLSLTPVIFDSSKDILLSLVFLLPLLTLRIIRYTRLHTNKNRQNQGNDHTRGIVVVISKDLDNEMHSYKMIHFLTIYEIYRYTWLSFMMKNVLNLLLFHLACICFDYIQPMIISTASICKIFCIYSHFNLWTKIRRTVTQQKQESPTNELFQLISLLFLALFCHKLIVVSKIPD